MLDLLFGWLIKPVYMITRIDYIVMNIEIVLIFFVIIVIYGLIQDIKEKRKMKNK